MGSFTNVLAIAERRLASRLRRASGAGGARWLRKEKFAAAAFQHNARTHSGPPSTGATITMDGGVADTTRKNTGR